MKTYQIKTYNVDWSYKDTINPNDILNEVSFTENINGGAWQMIIDTQYKIDDQNYKGGELVKVVVFDEYHKWWMQIYFWYISQIVKKVQQSREYTSFVCLWVNSLLNNVLFTNWVQSKTPSAMIKQVLTYFQNYYNCITEWSIDSSITTTKNYNRQYKNCFEIIKEVCEWNGLNFYVDWDWKLNVFKTWNNHFLKLHYDIDEMTITDTIEEMVNRYTSESWSGALYTYYNQSSIDTYWLRQKYEKNSELNDASTNQSYALQYLNDHYLPKETMTIKLNTNFPFENIKPWDTINVLNTTLDISWKKINKISYKPDQCVLTIDKTDTLWNVIDSNFNS